jgi:hypothetical protein
MTLSTTVSASSRCANICARTSRSGTRISGRQSMKSRIRPIMNRASRSNGPPGSASRNAVAVANSA